MTTSNSCVSLPGQYCGLVIEVEYQHMAVDVEADAQSHTRHVKRALGSGQTWAQCHLTEASHVESETERGVVYRYVG